MGGDGITVVEVRVKSTGVCSGVSTTYRCFAPIEADLRRSIGEWGPVVVDTVVIAVAAAAAAAIADWPSSWNRVRVSRDCLRILSIAANSVEMWEGVGVVLRGSKLGDGRRTVLLLLLLIVLLVLLWVMVLDGFFDRSCNGSCPCEKYDGSSSWSSITPLPSSTELIALNRSFLPPPAPLEPPRVKVTRGASTPGPARLRAMGGNDCEDFMAWGLDGVDIDDTVGRTEWPPPPALDRCGHLRSPAMFKMSSPSRRPSMVNRRDILRAATAVSSSSSHLLLLFLRIRTGEARGEDRCWVSVVAVVRLLVGVVWKSIFRVEIPRFVSTPSSIPSTGYDFWSDIGLVVSSAVVRADAWGEAEETDERGVGSPSFSSPPSFPGLLLVSAAVESELEAVPATWVSSSMNRFDRLSSISRVA